MGSDTILVMSLTHTQKLPQWMEDCHITYILSKDVNNLKAKEAFSMIGLDDFIRISNLMRWDRAQAVCCGEGEDHGYDRSPATVFRRLLPIDLNFITLVQALHIDYCFCLL